MLIHARAQNLVLVLVLESKALYNIARKFA